MKECHFKVDGGGGECPCMMEEKGGGGHCKMEGVSALVRWRRGGCPSALVRTLDGGKWRGGAIRWSGGGEPYALGEGWIHSCVE